MKEYEDDDKKEKIDYEFKIITLGNSGTGKTSIIKSFVDDVFDEYQLVTLGNSFSFKKLKINGINIKLNFIDTSGQEKFRSLSLSYFRHVDVVLFVFDLNEQNSFKSVQYWIDFFNENNSGKNIKSKYLVGNKDDLAQKVDQDLIDELTRKNNILFFSTSAKNKNNIDLLFNYITNDLYDYIQKKPKNQNDNNTIKANEISKIKVNQNGKKCCG
jgi:small GTP-binding protein